MSEDELLTEADEQAGLSFAYVHAVATRAGYTCHEPSGPDRDSVDVQISAGGSMRPKLDLQLKSRIQLKRAGEVFRYPLKPKNYRDLTVVTQTPRLLVILDLPRDEGAWLEVRPDELLLRRAACWADLRGLAASENTTSMTVDVPAGNVFNPDQLKTLMERSRAGWPKDWTLCGRQKRASWPPRLSGLSPRRRFAPMPKARAGAVLSLTASTAMFMLGKRKDQKPSCPGPRRSATTRAS